MGPVHYSNGLWVAASGVRNGLYYSTDGKVWVQSNITSDSFNSIYYSNGIWVAGGYGVLYYSDSPDNNKILQVVNGEWAMVAVPNAEEVAY